MADALITPQMQAVLARLEARDASERAHDVPRAERLRQIPRDVGRFLQALVLASRPRTIVEIGASGGYSTTWLASAALHVGARVATLEIDPVKVALASAAINDAGFASVATVVAGDAFAWLRARKEPIDFVFLDAEKEDYAAFLDLITPLLPAGGVLVADNLLSHPDDLAAFRQRALADPRLAGLVVPIGRGELVAVRLG